MIRKIKYITLFTLFITPFVFANPDSQSTKQTDSQDVDSQLAKARLYASRMRDILLDTKKLAQHARKVKDIIRLNCIDDKIIQIRGRIEVSKPIRNRFEEAVKQNLSFHRHNEFFKLERMYESVRKLGLEAESCIGEEISGKTIVEMEVDESLTGDEEEDSTKLPKKRIIISRPPDVSAWR